jgi:hypothetical protein
MNGKWNWLIGRKLSLGEVIDVFDETATVRHGDDEFRVLLSELMEEDYKEQARFAGDLNGKSQLADSYQIGGDHYKELAVQPWAAMQSWMSEAEFAGFLRGNAIKYLARAGRKGDDLQDLQKAMHYLEKLVSMKQDRSA